jgi:predicted Zn-dependent protease
LALAGDYEEAIAWAKFAATHDPHPKGWYFDNLIDAYDMAGKWPDALKLAEAKVGDPVTSKYWYKVLARAYAGTNQLDKAKTAQEMYEGLPYPPE